MTLASDDSVSTFRADAEQAAYFRAALVAERDQLVATVTDLRSIDERQPAGRTASTWHVRRTEAELRYVDGFIAGLDRRFSACWR